MKRYQRQRTWLFLLSLSACLLSLQVSALPAKPIHRTDQLSALCSALNEHLLGDSPRFYTTMDALTLLPYDSSKGVLPMEVGPSWSALGGTLQLVSRESTFSVEIPPDEASFVQRLANEQKLHAVSAFYVDVQRPKPCEHRREAEQDVYTFYIELDLVDIVRSQNQWPVLRYESERYQKRKLELRSRVMLTDPNLLEGKISIDQLRLTALRLRPQLRNCYQKTKVAQGTITIKVSLTEAGTADWVNVTIDTLGDELVTRCVQESFAQGRFPPSQQGSALMSLTIYFLENP